MRITFLALLFIISLTTTAQKNTGKDFPAETKKGHYLNLNVLSLFDTALPTIQPGYEYRFNDKWSLEAAAGIPVQWIGNRKTDSTFYTYYKMRATLKYYLDKFFFIGFESFYTHAHYSQYYYHYRLGKERSDYFSDFAIARKSVVGFDLKAGFTLPLSKRISVAQFSGVGIRFVNIKLPTTINSHPLNYYPTHGFQNFDVVGNKITPHLTFGFQVAYKL